MKSIRTEPHGYRDEGDERIRTAVPVAANDPVYEPRRPPERLSILFCRVCGRDDRFTPFTGKSHFTSGGRCQGKPERVYYEPVGGVS